MHHRRLLHVARKGRALWASGKTSNTEDLSKLELCPNQPCLPTSCVWASAQPSLLGAGVGGGAGSSDEWGAVSPLGARGRGGEDKSIAIPSKCCSGGRSKVFWKSSGGGAPGGLAGSHLHFPCGGRGPSILAGSRHDDSGEQTAFVRCWSASGQGRGVTWRAQSR